MRIVNRETFLAMPKGTLFSKVDNQSCDFGHMAILSRTGGGDFWYKEIGDQWDALTDVLDVSDGGDLLRDLQPMEFTPYLAEEPRDEQRDAHVGDKGQLFAVWEKKEILKLIAILTKSLNTGPNVYTEVTAKSIDVDPVALEHVMLKGVCLLPFGVPQPTGNIYTKKNSGDAIVKYNARVLRGSGRGEFGSPKVDKMPLGEAQRQRLLTIYEHNVAIAVARLDMRDDGLYGDVYPAGPMGEKFLELWNRGLCRFAIRCLTKPTNEGREVVLADIIAFDVGPVEVDQPDFDPDAWLKEIAKQDPAQVSPGFAPQKEGNQE